MRTVVRLVACLAMLAGTVVWAETLNNDGVIQLHKLGLGDSVVVEKIKSSTCKFDTSVDALKALKDAGLSDVVIQAMIAAGSPSSGSAAVVTGDPNDPNAPHQSGIWLYETVDGKPKMTQMKPSPIEEVKTGSGFGMAWGGSAKSRAILSGLHASTQLAESQPVFYFYFDKEAEGLSSTGSSATSPDDFSLATMDIHKDKQERRLEIGKYTMGGSRIGLDKKQVHAITSEKIADRVFKVTPVSSLKPGEYCFVDLRATSLAGGGKLFDFGVGGGEK
jgi:hypothetical protein